MDRRQLKTRKAIFRAFRSLLEKKRYDHITVQEIIDEADVGRSTFYAHFQTKDLLLDAMCQELFYHIFENDPCPYKDSDHDIEGTLAHILWHIKESGSNFKKILLSDSGELFMEYFKKHLKNVFEAHIEYFKPDIPRDFMLNLLVGSFCEMVRWWMMEGMKTSPDTTASYFMKIIEKHN